MAGNENLHGLNLTLPATGATARPTRQAAATGAPTPIPRTGANVGRGGQFPVPPLAPFAQLPERNDNIPIPPNGPTLQEALHELAMWKACTEALENTVAAADVHTALQTGNPSKEVKKPVLPDVVPGHKANVLDSTHESNSLYHIRSSCLHDEAYQHHVLSMPASYDAHPTSCLLAHTFGQDVCPHSA